jgi:hypothetical protein
MTPAPFTRSLQILFFALLSGQILVCTILYFIWEIPPTTEEESDLWLKIASVATIALLGLGMFLRKKNVEQARTQTNLEDKKARYRAALVLQWALTESATMLNVVVFCMTSNMSALSVAAAVILFFAMLMPTRGKLVDELELNFSEQNQLD